MEATVRLRLGADAPVAFAAIKPDDESGVSTQLVGETVEIIATSDSPMGLLRALDDVLGCLRALEQG